MTNWSGATFPRENIAPRESCWCAAAAALIREIEGRELILDEEIDRAVGLRRERMRAEDQPASSEQSDVDAESAP